MSPRALVPWLLLIGLALACGSGSDKFTAENYAAIQGRMKMDEVQAILGPPETAQKSGNETIWYYGSGKVTAAITFRGRSVIHKGETGLNVGDAEY